MPQRPALGTDPATASATEVEYLQKDTSKMPCTNVIDVQVVNPRGRQRGCLQGHVRAPGPMVPGPGRKSDTATVRYGWSLTDSTTGVVRLTGQINQRDDQDYRVVDGLLGQW